MSFFDKIIYAFQWSMAWLIAWLILMIFISTIVAILGLAKGDDDEL